MKKILSLFFVLQALLLQAQVQEAPSPIRWYTLEQAQDLAAKEPRPFLVDVYTDWCGWCTHMMKTTFVNPDIVKYIETNYYPVRFDAETNDTIQYKGKTYVNSDFNTVEAMRLTAEKEGKPFTAPRKKFTHDLAKFILKGQLSYPTLVYIDRQGTENPVPGFMDVNKIQPFLVFFAEDAYNNAPIFEEYLSDYYFTFPQPYSKEIAELPATQKADTTGTVKWLSFAEAVALNKKEPRKFFLDIYANWRVTCHIMEKTTYRNAKVAKLLNEKYYPIRFDSFSKDTVEFMGQKTINEGKVHPYHQLAVSFAVADRRINFPTMVFFDSEMKPITKSQNYMAPSVLEAFLTYMADESYKNTEWPTYYKDFATKNR